MRKTLWAFIQNLVIMLCFLGSVCGRNSVVQEKAGEAMVSSTPREGNTTFLGGTTWCVARPGASQADLKIALDWACGIGRANCHPIQAGGPCFQPDTLVAHASYAFNHYYQQNGNNAIACHFGGTAAITANNPSYANCYFASSRTIKTSSSFSYKYRAKSIWRKVYIVPLILYLSRR